MGPLEYLVIGFEDGRFDGSIARELDHVREAGIIRVIDLLFVSKDPAGEVTVREVSDLTEEEAASLGMVDAPGDGRDHPGWFSQDELDGIASDLRPSTSTMVMMIEHVWADRLRTALRAAGGFLISAGGVPPDVVEQVESAVGR